MNTGRSLFSQMIDHLSPHEFRKCVARYDGNRRVRSFTCWDQFLCMAFAQFTFRESLRDIVSCLRSADSGLYHLGIRGNISRSTLADANESRDWRIYCDFARTLIAEARELYLDHDLGIALTHKVYALDSTVIDLCMSLFPWAVYKSKQHAVKVHTQIDLRGNIPTFLHISPAKLHDVNFLDHILIEAAAFYIMDRGYLDFERLYRFTTNNAFFVTRPRGNFRFKRIASAPVDKPSGVRCDQTVALVSFYPRKAYPQRLRRIRFYDVEQRRQITFITNNFTLPAKTIADLYRLRWQIELFFKWIKQHLRIKAFYGTSDNAVRTQIWIAVCVYLVTTIAHKRLELEIDHHTMMQILSVSIFEKTPAKALFSTNRGEYAESENHKQLKLFEL
jgi:Transposase DDE domain/Domain of unknown function (DUF4372)